MRVTYLWLSRLIAIGVVLQAAFIAWGTFDIFKAADDGEAFTESTDYNIGQTLHGIFGMAVIPLLALAMLVVAFFAKVPRGTALAGAVFGLVVLQFLLALIAFPLPVLGVLHGVNAFVMAGVAGVAGRQASKDAAPPQAAAAATT